MSLGKGEVDSSILSCGTRLSQPDTSPSNERVVRPLQQRLALARAAEDVSRLAIGPHLPGMAGKGAPAPDLDRIDIGQAAAEIIAAIPLEPAARVRPVYPALLSPHRKRLAALDAETVQCRIGPVRNPRLFEPACREFAPAVVAILALEDAEFEHFDRREMRGESGGETSTVLRRQFVGIAGLHAVID